MPKYDTCSDGDVEGMFRPELGKFDAAVRKVDDFLLYSLDLVTEDEGVFFTGGDG